MPMSIDVVRLNKPVRFLLLDRVCSLAGYHWVFIDALQPKRGRKRESFASTSKNRRITFDMPMEAK